MLDKLSMKGKSPMFSTCASFALSSSKVKGGVFQEPESPFKPVLRLIKKPGCKAREKTASKRIIRRGRLGGERIAGWPS